MNWSKQVFIIAILVWGGSVFPLVSAGAAGPVPPAERSEAAGADTIEVPSIEEARQLIVGTWIENIAQELGNHEKGKSKWVFTQGGTLRKYRRNDTGEYELYGTYDYNIVGQYKGKEAPEDITGYLEFTEPEGGTYYMTIESIHRGEKRPHLYVGTHGMAGNTESIYFMPPRIFE